MYTAEFNDFRHASTSYNVCCGVTRKHICDIDAVKHLPKGYLNVFTIQFHIKLQSGQLARMKGMKMQLRLSQVAQKYTKLS